MAWTPLPQKTEITVETPQPKEFVLDPAKTAVIVVDMQKTPGHHRPRVLDVIPGNERLLAKAREAGVKVIYIQSLRQPESPDHVVFKGERHLQPGTPEVEIFDAIAPQPGEPVIQKWSNDVWAWYGIEAVLEREGIVAGEWTVLVTGVSAAACAEACALGFANRMYRVLIPLDATVASIEAEARTFAMYQEADYRHTMDFTLSTMVTFASGSETAKVREAVATT